MKRYNTGEEFLAENRDFLLTDSYQNSFMIMDAPYLTESNNENYALRLCRDGKQLVALKVQPFHLMMYGDVELIPELVEYIVDQQLEVGKSILASIEVCEAAARVIREKTGKVYKDGLLMDFMTCDTITEPSSELVEKGSMDDAEEVTELMQIFIRDCGLNDTCTLENVQKRIENYRYIKMDGKIVAMARLADCSNDSKKVTDVLTVAEYRGRGLARQVVNYIKNEIIEAGFIATLNVDKKNPVSNHLYRAIGFQVLFSQGEYRLEE